LLRGEPEVALELAERLPTNFNDHHALRIQALHDMGGEEFDTAFAEFRERFPNDDYETAGIHAWLGNVDEAFECLERGVGAARPLDVYDRLNTPDPRWRKLHGDPRWRRLLEATRQTEEDHRELHVKLSRLTN